MQQSNVEGFPVKKYLPYIIGAVVVLGGVGTYAIIQSQNNGKQASDSANNSTGDSKTVAKKYSDACALFTKRELSDALGGTFGNGEEEYAPSSVSPGSPNYEELKGSACSFDQDNDGTTTGMTESVKLSVAINNHESVDTATGWMNELHTPPTAEGKESVNTPIDVKGVGDQAFFVKLKVADTVDDKTESLYVRVGKQVIVLTATRLAGIDHDNMQASLTKLAKKL